MKRILYLAILFLLPFSLFAEVRLLLKSGQTLSGDIVFRNDEVVILRDAFGQRFQYPVSEIESLVESDSAEQTAIVADEPVKSAGRKVGLALHLSGGLVGAQGAPLSGDFAAKAAIGACDVLHRRIFIGIAAGYRGIYMPEAPETPEGKVSYVSYTFVPLQVLFFLPLLEGPHAPAVGASLGYGFAVGGGRKGGVAADIDVGWRARLSDKSALFLGLTASLQQGTLSLTEQVSDRDYAADLDRTFGALGLKLALYF